MPVIHKNITDPNLHEVKGFASANNGDYGWKNEKGVWEFSDELVLPGALNFVDASVAPPTTNTGDIYVLSSGGSVDAGWGGAAGLKDWVRYDGSAWNVITPQKSSLCYNKDDDTLYRFDGTEWIGISGGIASVTSAEKAALSPATGDFVYDTDLESLQRYNGSSWVDIAKGYGLVEVITSADSGVPAYFTDLQTALEECKTSGSSNVVKLHSNISLSAQIDINYGGTGTGNNYKFESLLIDFNGFKVTFDDAGTTDAFNIQLQNSAISNQKIIFTNGIVSRLNGTGTHNALNMPATHYANVQMSGMTWYCQNSQAASLAVSPGTTFLNQKNDLGGSTFVSDASSGYTAISINGFNYHVVSLGNAGGSANPVGSRFTVKCYGSGLGVSAGSTDLSFFSVETNTGDCLYAESNISFCDLKSTSGRLMDGNSIGTLSNSRGVTGNSTALNVVIEVNNSYIENDSSSDTITFPTLHVNSTFINKGSGKVANVNFNTRAFRGCYIESVGGVPITTQGSCDGEFYNCEIVSKWNNAGGHAISCGHTSNTVYIANCVLKVANSSANGIYAASAVNAAMGNTGVQGATTPINANVTIALTAAPDANGNYSL